MLINVTYNKQDGSITLDKDIKAVNIELSQSSIEDNANQLYFEIAVDTSEYEYLERMEEEE